MMNRLSKIVASTLLVAVVATQAFGVWGYIIPQDNMLQQLAKVELEAGLAQAAYPILGGIGASMGTAAAVTSVPSITTFDTYSFANDWWKQLALGVAYTFAQKFMQRFVSKLTEKYKIRNFLYYDQILTNYYLNNFIRDKISDPDLRQVYALLESEFVTGQPNGTTAGSSGVSPRAALIPRLKRAITNLYIEETGVDPTVLANPAPTTDRRTYLDQISFFFFNNPGYVETNLRQEFGEFQTAATTAAQLEVLVGNGLKAGRFVGGVCEGITELPQKEGEASKINDPASCASKGGTWSASALDKARSFIDNPTSYVDKWMGGMVTEITGSNFDPNNFWFTLGNAFGNFLVHRLMVDKPNGVLNEDPRGYVPTTADLGEGTPGTLATTDLDGDTVPDGYDIDGDGVIDSCVYGGVAPACVGSKSLSGGGLVGGGGGGGGGSGPCKNDGLGTEDYLDDVISAFEEVVATNPGGIADAYNTTENSGIFIDEMAEVLRSRGFESTGDVLNGNSIESSTNDIIAIWKSGDTKAERYDVIGSAGAGDRPIRDVMGTEYSGDIPIDECT